MIKRRWKRLKNERGQALVEFAIVLPILLLLVCGIIDFGWLFYNQLALNNSCREGARFAVVNVSETNFEALVEAKILSVSPDSIKEDLTIDIELTNLTAPLTGDVVLTLTADIKVLTPVLGMFSENQERTITSQVVMKAES